MKKILVPVSFSETSKRALQHANAIALQYGATLSLLHCYAAETYNRKYDFGKEAYDSGMKKMIANFYKECIENSEEHEYKLITYAGSVSDAVFKISTQFNLLVMCRKTGIQTKLNKFFTDKIFYISSNALCPTLITVVNQPDFSLQKLSSIWHIKRDEIELRLINAELNNLGIDKNIVKTKWVKQEKFMSLFWKNIVTYTKTKDIGLFNVIAQSHKEEQIGLLILVNHLKGIFEIFLKYDAFQIISQFDIPILILQAKNKTT